VHEIGGSDLVLLDAFLKSYSQVKIAVLFVLPTLVDGLLRLRLHYAMSATGELTDRKHRSLHVQQRLWCNRMTHTFCQTGIGLDHVLMGNNIILQWSTRCERQPWRLEGLSVGHCDLLKHVGQVGSVFAACNALCCSRSTMRSGCWVGAKGKSTVGGCCGRSCGVE
jgi:hypothetical protein